jgi:translation initiation factor IF-1
MSSHLSQIKSEEGVVTEALPGLTFRIVLKESKEQLLGHLAGKLKIHHIRVLPGDRVLVEMSPDRKRGRVVRRL